MAGLDNPEGIPGHPTPGMQLWGWMTPAELTWLASQAKLMRSVVEVGSLHGRSSFALASACPGPVYCIDPWDDPDGFGWESWNRSVRARLPNAKPVRGYSPDAGRFVPDPIDMVFLDGAHDRRSVEADIDHWLPRTKRLLCGHDYNHEDYPDVRAVVDERFGNRIEVPADMSIWVLWID